MSRYLLINAMRVSAWVWIVSGVALAVPPSDDPSEKPPSVEKDAGWVEKRIAEWQPTKAERAFDEIGWASSLSEAESLAQKHGRGIFLFTYDGDSLTGYRC